MLKRKAEQFFRLNSHMETILITGGSGIIGSELIEELKKKGYSIRILSRSKKSIAGVEVFTWDISSDKIEDAALEGVDHIIHLAGASVSEGRWTRSRKNQIEDSRIKAIDLLKTSLGTRKIKSFISASGVSIYGTVTSDQIFKEDDAIKLAEDDYLGAVSKSWEKAANIFSSNAERVVTVRTPVVLSRSGGALEKMLKPINMGVGSALGNGKQYMPWVHIDDLVKAYLLIIEKSEISGAINVVSPHHVTNVEFVRAIASVVGKKIWAPKVPAFLLRLMFGQMASIILKGSRVSGEKIKKSGFVYSHSSLEQSLQDLL